MEKITNEEMVNEEELTDMFGEGGKEEVIEFYKNLCDVENQD